jgi:hypothetical protein
MGKSSAPSAPDPYASAQAQEQFGTQAAAYNAALNQVNQVGPTGSTTYAQTGTNQATGAPTYTSTTQLSQPEQQLLSGSQELGMQSQELAGNQGQNVANTLGNYQLPTQGQNQAFGQQAQQAAYGVETASMDPYWNQQQEGLDASLRNSGATPGTPAYDNAMQSFQANRSSAYGQAENQSFGQGLSAEGQQISDVNQAQGGQIANYLSLATGTPGATSATGAAGNTTTGASTSAPDIMSAFQNQYQGQLANYNAGVASSNADTGAAAGLGAAALLALA